LNKSIFEKLQRFVFRKLILTVTRAIALFRAKAKSEVVSAQFLNLKRISRRTIKKYARANKCRRVVAKPLRHSFSARHLSAASPPALKLLRLLC
jgi:hypothetical protein